MRGRTSVHKIAVGERYGRLTVLTVSPYSYQCDCGNIVRNRTPYHVKVLGVISCGCSKREVRSPLRETSPNYKLIGLVEETAENKAVHRRWKVLCRVCGAELEVSDTVVKCVRKNTGGCRLCRQKEKR